LEDHTLNFDLQYSEMTSYPETMLRIPRPGFLSPQLDPQIAPLLRFESNAPSQTLATPKLYLVPTPQGLPDEETDPLYLPQPSALSELPDINPMVENYVIGVVEIWSGRRSAMQLSRASHRLVFQKLSQPVTPKVGPGKISKSDAPRIRKIYISQPIEGVLEVTVTLRFGERVRSLMLRFEGVDKRWLCTEFNLL